MAFGIKCIQGGVVLADGSSVHPAPITVDVAVLIYLSFTGSTTSYEWTLTVKPVGSGTVISSASSPSPTILTDIDGGSYVVTLRDDTATLYTLDIVTPSTPVDPGTNIPLDVSTIAGLRLITELDIDPPGLRARPGVSSSRRGDA